MMKHCDGCTPLGQDGATIGVEVWPNSTILAEAALVATPAARAVKPAISREIRFINLIEHDPASAVAAMRGRCRLTRVSPDGAGALPGSVMKPLEGRLELRDVHRFRALGPRLLLIGDL